MVFSVNFWFDIQTFFLVWAFHINQIDNDFSAFSFHAAHDDNNNLNFCICCHFNCVFMKFFSWYYVYLSWLIWSSYEDTQQNVPKSSNTLRMKQIKTRKAPQTTKITFKTSILAHERQYTLQIMVKTKIMKITHENHDEYHNFYEKCSTI